MAALSLKCIVTIVLRVYCAARCGVHRGRGVRKKVFPLLSLRYVILCVGTAGPAGIRLLFIRYNLHESGGINRCTQYRHIYRPSVGEGCGSRQYPIIIIFCGATVRAYTTKENELATSLVEIIEMENILCSKILQENEKTFGNTNNLFNLYTLN
jgi:hypothetical protein